MCLVLTFILSSAAINFGLLVLIYQLRFDDPWTIAAFRALIATVLSHCLFFLWLCRRGEGKGPDL